MYFATKSTDISNMIFDGGSIETAPEFPGGQNALKKFIQECLCYPADAWNDRIEETVVIQFYVEADGKLSDFKIQS